MAGRVVGVVVQVAVVALGENGHAVHVRFLEGMGECMRRRNRGPHRARRAGMEVQMNGPQRKLQVIGHELVVPQLTN